MAFHSLSKKDFGVGPDVHWFHSAVVDTVGRANHRHVHLGDVVVQGTGGGLALANAFGGLHVIEVSSSRSNGFTVNLWMLSKANSLLLDSTFIASIVRGFFPDHFKLELDVFQFVDKFGDVQAFHHC